MARVLCMEVAVNTHLSETFTKLSGAYLQWEIPRIALLQAEGPQNNLSEPDLVKIRIPSGLYLLCKHYEWISSPSTCDSLRKPNRTAHCLNQWFITYFHFIALREGAKIVNCYHFLLLLTRHTTLPTECSHPPMSLQMDDLPQIPMHSKAGSLTFGKPQQRRPILCVYKPQNPILTKHPTPMIVYHGQHAAWVGRWRPPQGK